MNILQLEINDLKKIRAVEIHPESGKPVILTGDNGNGKSSVLDAIVLALSNTGLEDPIRHGRPSASVKITLGSDKAEFLLERKVTKKGAYLTLTDAEGVPVQKAQTFLNGLLGNYAFDPLEFTRLKSKQQVEALKEAAGIDFTDLDRDRAEAYAARTEINRQGKDLKSRFDAMPAPAEGVPAEEISAVELMDNLRTLETAHRAISEADANVTTAKAVHAQAVAAVAKLKEQLAAAEETERDMKVVLATRNKELFQATEKAPSDEQLTAAREAIASVDATNSAVRAARERKEVERQLDDMRNQSARLNRKIEEIDETKAEAIKNSSLPLDGLEMTDDGVMFNGTFFSQLSTAEQIRVSTLVAMSQNPGLRIIIIREGALMNSANLAMIASLANEQGYQLWIEKFQENASETGIHIEDGNIVSVDGKELEISK